MSQINILKCLSEIFLSLGPINHPLPSLHGDASFFAQPRKDVSASFPKQNSAALGWVFQCHFTCVTYTGSSTFLTEPALAQLPQGLHQPFLPSAAWGLTGVICSLLRCPDFFWKLGGTMWKFNHLMKTILVLRISLKTLHFGIHKGESNRRSLVASVVYFPQSIDVVFAVFQSQAMHTRCCWALALCAVSSGSLVEPAQAL